MQLQQQEVAQEIEEDMQMPLEWFLIKIYLDNNSFQVQSFRFKVNLKQET